MLKSNMMTTATRQNGREATRPKRWRRVAKVASALAASACLAVPAVAAAPAAAAKPNSGTTITCYNFGDFTQCVCVTNGKGEWC